MDGWIWALFGWRWRMYDVILDCYFLPKIQPSVRAIIPAEEIHFKSENVVYPYRVQLQQWFDSGTKISLKSLNIWFFFSVYMSSSTEDWQTFPFISYRIDMDKCRMTITGTLMINFPFTLADVWKRSRGFLLRFTIVNSFDKAIKIMQRTFQFIWKNYDLERKLEQVSN